LLAAGEIAGHEALSGWEIVRVPEGEDYAANCIRVNDALLVARGFPATSAQLRERGYNLVPLDMSEYQKMDGGLSCLSLRW
jgi:dimethylargininase